jgi:hypothetical protein
LVTDVKDIGNWWRNDIIKPAIFRRIFGNFRGFLNFIIFSMISRRTPDEVSRNPDGGNADLEYRFSNYGTLTIAKHCLLVSGPNKNIRNIFKKKLKLKKINKT